MKKETEKLNLGYDWNKLEIAQAATSYLQEGENATPLARKSLELLLKDIGHSDSWLGKTAQDAPLGKAINNCLTEYVTHKSDQTIKDYLEYHDETVKKYVGENASVLQDELAPFMNMKYGDVVREESKAKYILEGKKKHNLGSDEEVEKAGKTIKKYEKIMATIGILENKRTSELRTRVEDEYNKDVFKELYTKKEEGEEYALRA